MDGLIIAVILFVAMIVICRGKNKWDDNHPKKCDICGNTYPTTIMLKDGCIPF